MTDDGARYEESGERLEQDMGRFSTEDRPPLRIALDALGDAVAPVRCLPRGLVHGEFVG